MSARSRRRLDLAVVLACVAAWFVAALYAETKIVRVSAPAGIEGLTSNGVDITASLPFVQAYGRAYLTAAATNDTATMAALGLSVPVVSPNNYLFHLTVFASNTVAADGIKLDFAGGTATVSSPVIHCVVTDDAQVVQASQQTTALATDVTVATITGGSIVLCDGFFQASVSGTVAVQFAMNADTTGVLTAAAGSSFIVENLGETPP